METASKALMAIDGFCCIYVLGVMCLWLFLCLLAPPVFSRFGVFAHAPSSGRLCFDISDIEVRLFVMRYGHMSLDPG